MSYGNKYCSLLSMIFNPDTDYIIGSLSNGIITEFNR